MGHPNETFGSSGKTKTSKYKSPRRTLEKALGDTYTKRKHTHTHSVIILNLSMSSIFELPPKPMCNIFGFIRSKIPKHLNFSHFYNWRRAEMKFSNWPIYPMYLAILFYEFLYTYEELCNLQNCSPTPPSYQKIQTKDQKKREPKFC